MTTYYVRETDVRDEQLRALVTDAYLADVDEYIQNLALRLGLTVAEIKIPLPRDAKKLAQAYLCKTIAQDNIGINVQANGYGVEIDLYKVKWNVWNRDFENLEPLVTKEVLSGEADTPPEFAHGGIPIYRS